MDRNRQYRSEYFKDPENRKKKVSRLAERIKKLINDTKANKEKGMTYRKNMAGPCLPCNEEAEEVVNVAINKEKKEAEKVEKIDKKIKENVVLKRKKVKTPTPKDKCQIFVCATCNRKGHARSSHKDCLFSMNKNSKNFGKWFICAVFSKYCI